MTYALWLVRCSATLFATALMSVAFAPQSSAHGVRLKTLYSFCAKTNCVDGDNPSSGLLMDSVGNLYGATSAGGSHALNPGDPFGSVFELVRPTDGKGRWKHKILYSFCPRLRCRSGAQPNGDLIMDSSGSLYGVTFAGGDGFGTAFKLSPDGNRWKITTLHKFCAANCGRTEGVEPMGGLAYLGQAQGLAYDGVSPLYGVAELGGLYNSGTVFQLVPDPDTGKWKEETVHDFCSLGDCADGAEPQAALTPDLAGNLYGTTFSGAGDGGSVFKLTPDGKGWDFSVLFAFCNPLCQIGYNSTAPMTIGSDGTLYGTLTSGSGAGIFSLAPDGEESSVYRFCSLANCADGEVPVAAVTLDESGNFFTTAQQGGANFAGTFVEISRSGVLKRLYSFCSKAGCADGSLPGTRITLDSSGSAFGAARAGGIHGDDRGNGGTIYQVEP